jgi:hypothetical protein
MIKGIASMQNKYFTRQYPFLILRNAAKFRIVICSLIAVAPEETLPHF